MMKDDLEKFIAKNRERLDDKTPPSFVLDRILKEMEPGQKQKATGIVIPFRVIRWAAACIILIGSAVAFLTLRQQPVDNNVAVVGTKRQQSITKPDTATQTITATKPVQKGLDAVDEDLNQRKQVLVAKLEKRPAPSQKLVSYTSNTESPASRLAATVDAGKLKNADNTVIDAFVETLNTDPNSNVRLAALDGLAQFYQEAYVRKQLLSSLKKQHEPVVQVAMINLLIRMRASGILEELETLVNDKSTQKPVKDCAYSGINQLQSI